MPSINSFGVNLGWTVPQLLHNTTGIGNIEAWPVGDWTAGTSLYIVVWSKNIPPQFGQLTVSNFLGSSFSWGCCCVFGYQNQ